MPQTPGSTSTAPIVPVEATSLVIDDLVKRYRDPILEVLVKFCDDLLDYVRDAKGIDVEDVRADVLGPLKNDLNPV